MQKSLSGFRRGLLVSLVVAVVLVVIGAALFASLGNDESEGGDSTESAEALREAEDSIGVVRRDESDVTAIGSVDAPLVIVEYAEFRCPFCGVFARDTFPQIKEEYIDTGKVRYEWRDFPVFGDSSHLASVAARAAGEQGLYWQYHDALFAAAPERGHLEVDRDRLIAWAEQIDIPDMEKFERDLENQELIDAVNADADEAYSLGATGTPTFFVGARPVVGAQPLESFEETIDTQLENGPEAMNQGAN